MTPLAAKKQSLSLISFSSRLSSPLGGDNLSARLPTTLA
jgi:hypothetical protein